MITLAKMVVDDDDDDRISELPEQLLHHILSFLPTKCVVSMSILSKRWRYVWVTIPVLDFRQWHSHDTRSPGPTRFEVEKLMNFVDKRLLFLHDRTTETRIHIQKFYFQIWTRIYKYYDQPLRERIDTSRVNAWVASLLQHKVEELILQYSPFQLPSCFSTCQSLTMLELDTCQILLPPESISFPRLKILRLTRIKFYDRLAQEFFSNCPVLEELVLTECDWRDIVVLCISAPMLKRLSIIRRQIVGDWYTLECCGLNVYAPSLLSFKYHDKVARYFDMHGLPSLVDAKFGVDFDDIEHRDTMEESFKRGSRATKLLENLSNVKLLKLSRNTYEALSFAHDPLTKLPTFHNLTRLEIKSGSCCSRTMFECLTYSRSRLI